MAPEKPFDSRVSLALRRLAGRPAWPADLARQAGVRLDELGAALEALERAGFVVEERPMEGLRLVEAPPALVAAEVAWGLEVERIGRAVRCVGTTSSTNDLAWAAVDQDGPGAGGLVVLAEHQSAGRGRRGNRWLSPPHQSILASAVVAETRLAADPARLTRTAAVAAARAVEAAAGVETGLKWPNDLVLDDRKVAGILVESRPGAGVAVVGIGINVGQGARELADAGPQATSLALAHGPADRTLLARELILALDRAAGQALDEVGAAGLRQEAGHRCRTIGQRMTVTEGGRRWTGSVVALDPDYDLVLRLDTGALRRFGAMTTHVEAGA